MLDDIVAQWQAGASLRSLAAARGLSRDALTRRIKQQLSADEYKATGEQHLQANKRRMHKGNSLHRRRKRHGSHPALPLLSVRVIRRRRATYRYIKIGPRQWISLARYLWEREHGRVPDGYFVGHADGDSMNDGLSNLRLVSAAANARAAVNKCDLAKRSKRLSRAAQQRRGVTARKRAIQMEKAKERDAAGQGAVSLRAIRMVRRVEDRVLVAILTRDDNGDTLL